MTNDAARFLAAPSTCGTEFDDVAWTGTIAVRVHDDKLIGIRFNDDAVLEHVRSALGDLVVDVPNPKAYYSVRLGTPGRRKAAPLHHLYFGARPVLGTRDLRRLLGGLEQHLTPHIRLEADDESSQGYVVQAVPVATPRGVLLVPTDILQMTGSVDRLLTPAGYAFADVPRAVVDFASATVRVRTPVVDLASADDRVAALGPSAPEQRLAPGTHPIVGWLLSVNGDQATPLRPAVAVAHTARLLAPPFPDGAQAALDALASMTASIPMTGVTWATNDELVTAVLDAGAS